MSPKGIYPRPHKLLVEVEARLKTRTWTAKQLAEALGVDRASVLRCMQILQPPVEFVRQGQRGPLARRYGPLP